MRKRDFRHLLKRDLGSRGRCDQNAAQFLGIVPEIPLITHIHRIALAAFDVLGDVHATNTGRDRLLHIADGEPILRRFGAVHVNVHIEALRDPLREDRPHLW